MMIMKMIMMRGRDDNDYDDDRLYSFLYQTTVPNKDTSININNKDIYINI
jgi:hypothetical protein